MSAIYILWLRELKRYTRSRVQLLASLGQPLMYLLVLGFGLGPVFQRAGGGSYLQFVAPGVIGMTVLFSSIFSGLGLLWDRQFGFLKETLVAPVPRLQIMIGRTLGGATVVRRGLWGLAGLCSLLVLGIHDQIAFGHADTFYLMDAAPGLRGRGFPGEGFLRMVLSRNTPEQRPIGRGGAIVLAVQGVLAVVLTVVAAVLTAVGWRRDRTPDVVYPALVGLAVIGGILVDQAIGGAWNRSVVLAAPCVLCLRRLPLPVLVVTTLAVGAVTALMSRSYFGGLLV